MQSVNVPVYGTFQFQGLEKSTLAGALNLMDMVSFRELYGFMSGDKLAEIKALQKEAGAHDVSRENAEAELFGKADGDRPRRRAAARHHATSRPTTTPGVSAVTHDLGESLGGKLQREEARSRVFPTGEVEQGVVLNAAVIVNDPKKIKETIAAIEEQGKATASRSRRSTGSRRPASSASSSTSRGSCSTSRSSSSSSSRSSSSTTRW